MDTRTALVVAHRLSTVIRMDQLIVLDKGRTVGQGTHHELLDKQGIYATLWHHQSDGFLPDTLTHHRPARQLRKLFKGGQRDTDKTCKGMT